METIKINADTWRIEDGFVRFFLLVGTERAILIDSGVSAANARETAESLTDKPVFLMNTHGDGDHTAGNGAFDLVYMHEKDYINCRLPEKYPDCALMAITDGNTFDLGGRTLEIIYIPGHTFGSVAVLDTRDRVLYSGDTVQDEYIYMFGDHRSPEELDASLGKLESTIDRFDIIFPSHGSPELPVSHIGRVRAAWRELREGRLIGTSAELFGNSVTAYEGDGCGFYTK